MRFVPVVASCASRLAFGFFFSTQRFGERDNATAALPLPLPLLLLLLGSGNSFASLAASVRVPSALLTLAAQSPSDVVWRSLDTHTVEPRETSFSTCSAVLANSRRPNRAQTGHTVRPLRHTVTQ